MRAKIQDEEFMAKIDKAMEQDALRRGVPAGVLGNALSKIPSYGKIDGRVMEERKRKISALANEEVRAKKHRDEAFTDRLLHIKEYNKWFWEQLQMAKAKRRQCEGKITALGKFRGAWFAKAPRRGQQEGALSAQM